MRRNHSVDYSRRYYLESYCGHIPAQVVSADCMWKDLTKVDSAALEITDIDEYSKAQIKPADLPLHGYMPLRGDCDVEYKDTAEDLLAEMERPPIEDIAGRSLKRQILRLYNGKLQERENRRCFFIKRGPHRKNQSVERTLKEPMPFWGKYPAYLGTVVGPFQSLRSELLRLRIA